MSLDKSNKTLIDFNVHDVQINVSGDTMIPLTYAVSISLEKQLADKIIYGDGNPQLTLYNDNGYTCALGLTALDDELDIALGFKEKLATGLADVQVTKSTKCSVFFETDYAGVDGIRKVKKVWLYGVELKPANESYSQDEDEINQSTVTYDGTIFGTNKKDSTGDSDYVDSSTGITPKVYKVSAIPTDTFYSDFEASVPVPKALA